MRFLFIAAGSAATVFGLAPLATAVRNAGHEVFMAANDNVMASVAGVGLPGVPVTPVPLLDFITKDRSGAPVTVPQGMAEGVRFTGSWFARMAVAQLERLLDFTAHRPPDVVVGGTLCYAAPLVAAKFGVPWVRHAWDAIDATGADPGAEEELAAELDAFGLDGLPEPDLFVDVCPPGIRPAHAPAARLMRWIPVTNQRALEPWLYAKDDGRPRICLTAGSRVTQDAAEGMAFLSRMVEALSLPDVELLVAAPDDVAAQLRADHPGIRAGWMPLDVLAPSCDLVVHHGGGTTALTALRAGVPQLILPQGAFSVRGAQALVDYGAALSLDPREAAPATVTEAARELLYSAGHRARAGDLARDIARLPAPPDLVDTLTAL
nr:glycosyltransferase [Streptomyces sp. NBC_00899]WSX81009.1 glycosyltransferase [Streptomyces sp. NBC_00899]